MSALERWRDECAECQAVTEVELWGGRPLCDECSSSADRIEPERSAREAMADRRIARALDIERRQHERQAERDGVKLLWDDVEGFRTLGVDDLDNLEDPRWIADQLIPEGTAVIFGQPSSLKSFIALDLALSVASGMPFLGHEVEQGPVLYVAAEGAAGLKKRVRAWRSANPDADLRDFRVLPRAVDLLSTLDVDQLAVTLHELAAHPRLLVIDTLARSMPGGDENMGRDMGRVIQALDTMPADCRLIVHHTGKDGESERGSTNLRGAADVMLKTERDGDELACTMTCSKPPKDGEGWKPIHLRAERTADSLVMLPRSAFDAADDAERHRRAAILDHIDREGSASQNAVAKALGGNRRAVIDTLKGMEARGDLETTPGPRSSILYRRPVPTLTEQVGTGQLGHPEDDLFREGGAHPRRGCPSRNRSSESRTRTCSGDRELLVQEPAACTG